MGQLAHYTAALNNDKSAEERCLQLPRTSSRKIARYVAAKGSECRRVYCAVDRRGRCETTGETRKGRSCLWNKLVLIGASTSGGVAVIEKAEKLESSIRVSQGIGEAEEFESGMRAS